jgi:hypothetical protein
MLRMTGRGGDGRNEAPGALLTARTAFRVEGKNPREPPGPPPAVAAVGHVAGSEVELIMTMTLLSGSIGW